MLDKTYDFVAAEARIGKLWDEANAFAAGAGAEEGAEAFSIVIPPPNVTGSLHMGHALNNTLQDVLVRFERMRGKNVLWQPGMDHAGIATQMVVERQLMENQEPHRREMGREKFVERIWQWKEESGGVIFNQLKRLGASCDWSRERFTMDDGLSSAVLEVFISLYEEGLIYKDKRLVNWDPKLHTAISDLEVEQVETRGHLWHFRYPLADGLTYQHPFVEDEESNRRDWRPSDGEPSGHEIRDYLVVATTRPETMLGDTGVAVHPDDPRYRGLVDKGAHVILPLVGRRIPVVADEYPDPEAGTGAVKMTPAHDFNDFEVGKRCNLPAINVMDIEAAMALDGNGAFSEGVPQSAELAATIKQLHGLDRFVARDRVVEMMEERGLIAEIESHMHMVPHGDRGGVPIEPYLTDQWYVDAATLAKPAIASVKEGRTNFVPKNWEKTYFDWMENIQPWCISRQLWWGHQIPAWYGPRQVAEGTYRLNLSNDDYTETFCAKSEDEVLEKMNDYYHGRHIVIVSNQNKAKHVFDSQMGAPTGEEIVPVWRDPDVLDTWFSSALWPFSTLGWPDKTPELEKYYQTDVLVTGFDIIFFWVARMMMMGLHFMKDEAGKPVEPFHTVYVHALVRDKHGAKMSKSKGNVIDPLELMDEYGADALRFTLAIMAAQGRDVKLDPARIAGYRNFGTKLWNATRFAEMNGVAHGSVFEPNDAELTINRWILTELSRTIAETTEAIENFRFNEAAASLYRFIWNQTCDWYLELLKPVFSGKDEAAKQEAQACAGYVLDQSYRLLHPFMPYMTEELWDKTASGRRDGLLCHAGWPAPEFADEAAADEINWLIDLVSQIRSVRAEMNIKPGLKLPLIITGADDRTRKLTVAHEAAILRLARIDSIEIAETAPKASAQIVIGGATACLPLEGVIDLSAEIARLKKEQGALDKEVRQLSGKLANEKFIANAPAEIVEQNRDRLAAAEAKRQKIDEALARLG